MLKKDMLQERNLNLGNLPIESHKLQAFVTEAVKPFLDHVVVYGVGGAHFYISQSDKGSLVFGGDLDWYKSYAQRGNLPMVQDVAEAAMAILPSIGRLRLLRHWAGVSLLGNKKSNGDIEPRLFSEDFSIMSNDKPGCFVLMGNGTEGSNMEKELRMQRNK